MKCVPLIVVLLSLATNLLPAKDGPDAEKPKTSPDVAAESNKQATQDNKTAESQDALKLSGFPNAALNIEPALEAAMALTPEQAKGLIEAHEETLEAANSEIASTDDKKANRRAKRDAQKEFASRRDMILTGSQISLIETMRTLLKESSQEAKKANAAGQDNSITKKDLFLSKVKTALNPEQLALVEAAGGKLP